MSYRTSHIPGTTSLVAATIFPAIVIVIELAGGLCANSFFDPLPTIGHLVLVGLVPVINLMLWRRLQRDESVSSGLLIAGGAAIAISACYTLLFLPILPFAAIGILLIGIGLLPFAPVIALVFAWRWTIELSAWHDRAWRRIAAGFALGIVALTLVDLPATATYIALQRYGGDAESQRSSVDLMRALGDRDILLRLSYGDTARATGLASIMASSWSRGLAWDAPAGTGNARELYYRVTGAAFNAVERPGRSDRTRLFGWDDDQGGDAVGGRVPGLSLAGSRIDGSVAAVDNLAYIEWTLDFRNDGDIQREARLTMALPEGAVASRATLWVNGEPREASIAGRGAARAAYAKVVSNSRDPLLVTTDGAGRLLVQAFPIAPHGTLKLRIGFTAPFAIAADGKRALAMPAIMERNFDLPPALRHSLWIEGDAPLASGEPSLPAHGRLIRASLNDHDLTARRPRIGLPRVTAPWVAHGGIPGDKQAPALAVDQRIVRAPTVRPSALMLVLDGSRDNAPSGAALAEAIDALPSGLPVGLTIAAETPVTIAPRPLSPDQRSRILTAIHVIRFRGGQDDRAALAAAIAAIPDTRATLLWIHGAQPVVFTRPEPSLDQALERLPGLPTLIRYQAQPGRAYAGDGGRWFATARFVTPGGDPVADLRATLTSLAGGTGWAITRTEATLSTPRSANLVRLWAAARIADAAGTTGKTRDDAVALAHRLSLITPVSGAVVLETDKDYDANGLPVPSPEDVPTVPEPETWALLAILFLAAGWLLRRQRQGMFA